MMNGRPLVIIGGATGVGKSDLAVKLAKRISGEIISVDSMQVYKGFNIGTAKITPEEMEGIPHHLIDILEPDQEFNVYEFKRLALEAMDKIYANGNIPILTGGTGFYIQAVLYDIQFSTEDPDSGYRKKLEDLAAEHGNMFVHDMLKEADPEAAAAIHPNNLKRTIRALEYLNSNGERISEHNAVQSMRQTPYNSAYFVLTRDRQTIYERVNKRVDIMLENGLADEVRTLLESGISPDSAAMQGIGYKEMVPYVQGEKTLEEAVYELKINTRHFAKRQNTWFKREKDAIWLKYEDYAGQDEMLDRMTEILKEKGIINV